MCLWEVTNRFDPPLKGERLAWKIVNEYGNTCFQHAVLDTRWKKNRAMPHFLREERDGLSCYISGFHCFSKEEDANWALAYLSKNYFSNRKGWRVIPVMVRGIICEGPDGSDGGEYAKKRLMCIVTEEIRLLTIYEKEVTKEMIDGTNKTVRARATRMATRT